MRNRTPQALRNEGCEEYILPTHKQVSWMKAHARSLHGDNSPLTREQYESHLRDYGVDPKNYPFDE